MRGHFRIKVGCFLHLAGDAGARAASSVRGRSEGPGPSFGKLYASEGRPSIPPENC